MSMQVPMLDFTGRIDLIKLPEDIGVRAPQLMQLTLAGPQPSTSPVGPKVSIIRRWGIPPLIHRSHPVCVNTVSGNHFDGSLVPEGRTMSRIPNQLHH